MASDPVFAERLNKLLTESLLTYGKQLTPVLQAQFPDTNQQPPIEDDSKNLAVVTNGETLPLGQPRSDIEAQKNGGEMNPELMSEVSSLLVSIGYILSKDGIVPDKFNTQAVLEFLNRHFPQNANVPCDINQPPIEGATEVIQQENPLYESRQLLEKSWIKKQCQK